MASSVAASRKHVELSLELKRKLIQDHEHGIPFTLLGKKYHIATSTAANIWRKKDFFLRSRMSGSRKRCNDRSKYKIVNQVTALFVKSMLERNHKIDGEVIKRFARTAAAQCNFKDFHGSNGWLDSFKKRENVCWVRRRGAQTGAPTAAAAAAAAADQSGAGDSGQQYQCRRSDSPNLCAAAAAAAALAITSQHQYDHDHFLRHNHHDPMAQHHAASCLAGAESSSAAASPPHAWDSDNEQQLSQFPPQPPPFQLEPASSGSVAAGSSGGLGGAAGELEQKCTRCQVAAAAAAAVAALSSGDSIHERDHEIEDWFHGIPFLCQFFEEYQSMHQQQPAQNPSAAAAEQHQQPAAAAPTDIRQHQFAVGQQQQQQQYGQQMPELQYQQQQVEEQFLPQRQVPAQQQQGLVMGNPMEMQLQRAYSSHAELAAMGADIESGAPTIKPEFANDYSLNEQQAAAAAGADFHVQQAGDAFRYQQVGAATDGSHQSGQEQQQQQSMAAECTGDCCWWLDANGDWVARDGSSCQNLMWN